MSCPPCAFPICPSLPNQYIGWLLVTYYQKWTLWNKMPDGSAVVSLWCTTTNKTVYVCYRSGLSVMGFLLVSVAVACDNRWGHIEMEKETGCIMFESTMIAWRVCQNFVNNHTIPTKAIQEETRTDVIRLLPFCGCCNTNMPVGIFRLIFI